MAIQIGDTIPTCTMKAMGEKGPADITTDDIFGGKKVVLFAVPGAFTPGCSLTHLPGYVVNADAIKAKGIDTIVCMAVNDAFVMDAWGKAQNAEELLMLADGNWGETDVIEDKEYIKAATSPSQKLKSSYGFLWWLNGNSSGARGPKRLISAAPPDMYAAKCALIRRLFVLPSQQLVIVRLGDQPANNFDSEFFKRLRLAIPETD